MANVRLAKRLRSLPSLDFLRGFECAARHLSFTRAGQELNVTQSAVSRQVKALEEQLRIELFHRNLRSLTLTDKGRELYDAISFALSDLESVVGKLSSNVGRRSISLSTTVSFAALWLIPRLGSFRASYPDIDVRLSATSKVEDLKRRRLDLAVRYGGPYKSEADTGVLFRERVVAVCGPNLTTAAGDAAPMKPEDLEKHVLLHRDDPRGECPWHGWSHLLKELGVPGLLPAGALYFSQYDQLVQAAVDGHGIAIGRRPLVDGLLEQGRLVELFPHCTIASGSYTLVQNQDACNEVEIAVLTNWLVEQVCRPLGPNRYSTGSEVPSMHRIG
ncbi:LysR substrate-binding domain-containing protein [Burkholderia cenocepacia]|uniref:LysR substrate-binding domain-containing protein n=1 Tax=Burkholderia cenocepacia TaxID=95486 RepID=UPI002864F59D|nr:LysR substrate-binding domain-containing protein [Burkholderia cenocepacia]MDR8071405.1 LysR family transcriptional regulator [Burkholderia cenocepacia]